MAGPLAGVRVAELVGERTAYAGKLLAELGAEVIVVEPPGGGHTRRYAPFHDDVSLWWEHYNGGKKSLVIAPAEAPTFLPRLFDGVDFVLEGEPPGTLEHDPADHPKAIWVSITPFGRHGPRRDEASTDLTVLASGGPVWSCGYDDHGVPPVRGGGNQSLHIAGVWAVIGALTALGHRHRSGRGQVVDVSMHAAANVTTEGATFEWLVARGVVQRQTARHARVTVPTAPTTTLAADGRTVTTGVPPRRAAEFQRLLDWMDELGLLDGFDDAVFLRMGAEQPFLDYSRLGADPEVTAMLAAGRDAMDLVAATLPGDEFFVEGQRRGFSTGVVNAPEHVAADPHLRARGFFAAVEGSERVGPALSFGGAARTG